LVSIKPAILQENGETFRNPFLYQSETSAHDKAIAELVARLVSALVPLFPGFKGALVGDIEYF
jgi:hypothetical protein